MNDCIGQNWLRCGDFGQYRIVAADAGVADAGVAAVCVVDAVIVVVVVAAAAAALSFVVGSLEAPETLHHSVASCMKHVHDCLGVVRQEEVRPCVCPPSSCSPVDRRSESTTP